VAARALAVYEQIAFAHPDIIGTCQAGIGAAHYFLGDYETAIEFYQKARANGQDRRLMQEGIDEAREAIEQRGHKC